MRLWHKYMIQFLPDMQLKGQWRECSLIADALAKNGTPNHLLVNRVTEYPLDHFVTYCFFVFTEMRKRGFNASNRATKKMEDLGKFPIKEPLFPDWHNKSYLRVCMANLYEKHIFGIGKSRITDEEWLRLVDGYKAITGEEYHI